MSVGTTLGQMERALALSADKKEDRMVFLVIGEMSFPLRSIGLGQEEIHLSADLGEEIQIDGQTFKRPEYIFLKEGWICGHYHDGHEEQITYERTHFWANYLGQIGIPFSGRE